MRSSRLPFVLHLAFAALLCGSVAAYAYGPGGGGAAGGGTSGGHTRSAPPGDPEPTVSIQAASQAAQQAIDVCDIHTPRCIADALDEYAAALRALAPRLPPELRNLPVIVQRAATRVRAAKTKTEAIAAVKDAIVAVHKSIALLKAEDPTFRAAEREGAFVTQTLQVADAKLEKAMGL
jgi:hypothetical protein